MTLTMTDTLTNEAKYSFTLTVRDGTAPRLTTPAFAAGQNLKQLQRLELDAWNKFADNDPQFPSTSTYRWTTDAPDVLWGSPQDRTLAILQFNATGNFTLRLVVADAAGNSYVLNFPVNVSDGLPPAGITWNVYPNLTVTLGTSMTFTASATDPHGVLITWIFGDGGSLTGSPATYEYPSVGHFQVTLIVADSIGNEAKIFFTVTVVEVTPGSGGGPKNPGGGGSGSGGGAFDSLITIVIVAAALVVGGLVAMYAVFRRKFKPAPPQEVIIHEESPGSMYAQQP